jgi:hypothetical protein
MNDVETLEANLRFAEAENRSLKQGLWDEFFKAALSATLHHGKITGVKAAAEIADEALRMRNAEIPPAAFRDLKGVIGVSISLLEDAVAVIETIESDDAEERSRLALLVEKMDRFVAAAREKV